MLRYILFLVFVIFPVHGYTYGLVTSLSTSHVDIESGFTGQKILVFGTFDTPKTDHVMDVVILIKGPEQSVMIRRKNHRFGIWVNNESLILSSVPSYYAIMRSSVLNQGHYQNDERVYRTKLRSLPFINNDEISPDIRDVDDFLHGFIMNKMSDGVYSESDNGVEIIDNRLFKSEIIIPSGVLKGLYTVDILLLQEGKLMDVAHHNIDVNIHGIAEIVMFFAQQYPLYYGLIGVMISISCGVIAAHVFGKYS